MGRILTDGTFANKLDKTNALLAMMVKEHIVETANWQEIGEIVRKGLAEDIFSIGDQLVVTWKDTAGNKEYQVPMDIVHFGDVELSDGEVVPGMFLQWHYCTPFGVQFDQNEALLYCENGLPIGTYYFTCGNSWGNNIVNGKSYTFTTTVEVPSDGQIQIGLANSEVGSCPDQNPSNWRIRTYASNTETTPLEILALTEGANGTNLGTWSSSTKYGADGLNNMQRSSYGYNRWSQSALRQYLNSGADKGKWWTPKNIHDRPPVELTTKDGFMKGFSEEFLAQLKPIKLATALNTVSDSVIGAEEDTFDTFFLATKTNENLKEQYKEGDVWEYWNRATNGVKPNDYETGSAPITYGIDNKLNPQTVWLRSASRGYASNTWRVNSSGSVHYYYATTSYRFAPACVIC